MVKLISQGSYGCIFRPGFQCNGRPMKTNKYITKVQRKKDISNKEAVIGSIIKKIPHFNSFFAPIIEDPCDINMGSIEDSEIKKCNFLSKKDGNALYETNKIEYVGKHSLAKYFANIYKKKPKLLLKKIVESHMHLLDGIKKLLGRDIIHFDLKDNNIMCKDKTGDPIIIDFGLSFLLSDVEKDDYTYAFFTYGPDYGPWCIEIAFITYIVNELGTDWRTQQTNEKIIKEIIDDFITKNDVIQRFLTIDEQGEYEKNITRYFITLFTGNNQTWKDVVDTLLKNTHTWDNYSLCVVYLYIIFDLHLPDYVKHLPRFGLYIELLKNIVVSMPDKRYTIQETKIQMKNIAKTTSKFENTTAEKELVRNGKNKILQEKIEKNIKETVTVHNNITNKLHIPP